MRIPAALLLTLATLSLLPTAAHAAVPACSSITDLGDRATCEAEQRARQEAGKRARTEATELRDAKAKESSERLEQQWQRAVERSKGYGGDIVSLRLVAAVGGLIWFWLALRHQRARRRRIRRS